MVPPKSHPVLRALVTGEAKPDLQCLALKILLGRLQMTTRFDPSEANVTAQISALHEFFEKNESLAQRDLRAILN